jgi:hypothetical protein
MHVDLQKGIRLEKITMHRWSSKYECQSSIPALPKSNKGTLTFSIGMKQKIVELTAAKKKLQR